MEKLAGMNERESAPMDGNPGVPVFIKQEKDPLAPDPVEAPATAELAGLPQGELIAVKKEALDPDQVPLPAVKTEPMEIPTAPWLYHDAMGSTVSVTGLPGSCIQPTMGQMFPSTNYTTMDLNVPGSSTVPVVYSPHNAGLTSALGSQAYLIDPLKSTIFESLPRSISDEIITPDLPPLGTPARKAQDKHPEIKLEQEDYPESIPSSPARVAMPHGTKPQSKQTAVPFKNLPGFSCKENTTIPKLLKHGTPKNIPIHSETSKRPRNSDLSEEESSGSTRRVTVTQGAKCKKDVIQEEDDSNAKDDPNQVAGLGESDKNFSDSEFSWEGSSNVSEDEDMENDAIEEQPRRNSVAAKTSPTRARNSLSTITQSQDPKDGNNEILDQNCLFEIFMDPSLVCGEGAVEESNTRVATKNAPEKVPLVKSRDSEVEIRKKTKQDSVQIVPMVFNPGGGILKTYSRRKKQTVVRGSAMESTITGGEPGSKIKVGTFVENSSVNIPRVEFELCSAEPKDETIEVTETTIQGYDIVMETVSKHSLNLTKRFSQALTKTVEGLTSKANALKVLRFAIERAELKKAEVIKNIFAESWKSLESRPAIVFANDNGQTVKTNARCIVKQVYAAAVALGDKSDRVNKDMNLSAECKETLQCIVNETLKCMDIGTTTAKNRKRAEGDSLQAGSDATDKEL